MTILFVHSGSDLYGAGRMQLRLAHRLVRDRHRVLVILPADGPLRPELEAAGAEVRIHPELPLLERGRFRSLAGLFSLMLHVPQSVARLVQVIRDIRPALVHSNTAILLSPGPAARIAGVPHVWHVREFFTEFPTLWRAYQRYMLALSDRIVCVSRGVAGQFDLNSDPGRVRAIHDGFPREEFEGISEERKDRFRDKFGLRGHLCVGVVGRIKMQRKGQDFFLRACGRIRNEFPGARFVLIGSPFPGNEHHRTQLEALAAELGLQDQVVWTGDADDIKAAIAALDVSVLASCLPEPVGNIVSESMALGLPVIGTRIGGTVEVIEDGVTGLLVGPNEVEELADALRLLMSDDSRRREMGRKGRERFLEAFEFQRYYDRVTQVYAEVTGNRWPSRG